MKWWSLSFTLLQTVLVLTSSKAAEIVLTATAGTPIIATATIEQVAFHETIGVGLADTRYDNIGYVDFKKVDKKTLDIDIANPAIVNITIAPQAGASGVVARTYPLYITPDEKLNIIVGKDGKLSFEGNYAARQSFLSTYFLENHYQHLPALGYRPTQPEFALVERQIDSLQTLRKNALKTFSQSQSVDQGFEQYVAARLMTEPYLLQTFVAEKKMRLQRAKRLSKEEKESIDAFTLENFKVLPDEALLSKSYRDELRHWIQIPIMKRYPLDSTYQQPLSTDAIKEIYKAGEQQLASYPQQKAYLATYWLNYATIALESSRTAEELLAAYQKSYPQSEHIPYFSTLINAKKALATGAIAPDIAFFKADSSSTQLHAVTTNPICLVFAFNIKQFENDLKKLEEQYGKQVTFIYLNVSPSIPFSFWKKNTAFRSPTVHAWASPTLIEQIKKTYVTEPRYPFVVIDKDKKIVHRWIQQEFPHNNALEAALKKAIQ